MLVEEAPAVVAVAVAGSCGVTAAAAAVGKQEGQKAVAAEVVVPSALVAVRRHPQGFG